MVGGKLNGDAARTFFMRSGLQQQILGRIWVLSDNDKDGQLSSNEFNVAMKLVRMARQVCSAQILTFDLKSQPEPKFLGSATSTFNPNIKFRFFPPFKPA